MEIRRREKSGRVIMNPHLRFYAYLLLGCFNSSILVSTSVINEHTLVKPGHNIQSDQGYTKGKLSNKNTELDVTSLIFVVLKFCAKRLRI